MKMNYATGLRRFLIPAAALLLAALPARADSGFQLDFVNDNSAIPGLDNNSTYITFINGVNGTLGTGMNATPIYVDTGNNALMSQSYSLADIANAGGFYFSDSAQATDFFITYGANATIFSNSTARPDPASTSTPRYSLVELAGGGGDLTDIDQFGGSLRVDDYNYSVSTTTPVKSTYNNQDTGTTFTKIYDAIGANSSAVVTSGGQFVRIIGPSKVSSNFSTAYPSYDSYLTSLNTGNVVTSLQNNYGNDNGTGMNNVNYTNSGANFTVGNQTWIAHYNFNATVDNSGNINFNGSVTMTGAANATGGNIVLSGLYITMPKDANLDPALYAMNPSSTTVFGNLANSTLTINGTPSGTATWDYLNNFTILGVGNTVYNTTTEINANNMGNTAVNLKVVGDLEEGLATGFVGSMGNVGNIMGFGNGTYGNLSSAQWWYLANEAYLNGAQSGNSTFFNLYGLALFGNSNTTIFDGTNSTVLSGGAVYSSPYDDRFGSALLSADDKWTVTILSAGNLAVPAAVPEPATDALLAALAVLLGTIYYRRKLQSPTAAAETS